jgi:hypothetical protein
VKNCENFFIRPGRLQVLQIARTGAAKQLLLWSLRGPPLRGRIATFLPIGQK